MPIMRADKRINPLTGKRWRLDEPYRYDDVKPELIVVQSGHYVACPRCGSRQVMDHFSDFERGVRRCHSCSHEWDWAT